MNKYKITFTKRDNQNEVNEYIIEETNINIAINTASERLMKKMKIKNTNNYDVSCTKI